MGSELLLRRDFAACKCGCGQLPPPSPRTTRRIKVYKGEPLVCVPGHQGRLGARKNSAKARNGLPVLNPSGLCWCGCGATTGIARQTDRSHGEYAGQHNRFVRGHQAIWAAQEGNRQRWTRQLCVTCYEYRLGLAFLDGTPVCIVCVARQRRVAVIDQRLQDKARQKTKRLHEGAVKARRVQKERGFKPSNPMTIVRKAAR